MRITFRQLVTICLTILAIGGLYIQLTQDTAIWATIGSLIFVVYAILNTWLEIKTYIGRISRKSSIKDWLFIASLIPLLVLFGFVIHRLVELVSGEILFKVISLPVAVLILWITLKKHTFIWRRISEMLITLLLVTGISIDVSKGISNKIQDILLIPALAFGLFALGSVVYNMTQMKRLKRKELHDQIANQLEKALKVPYNRGKGPDFKKGGVVVEVEATPATFSEGITQVRAYKGKRYLSTDNSYIDALVKRTKHTKVGVMKPNGTIIKPATPARSTKK